MPSVDFSKLRSEGEGQAAAFEELSAQLFRHLDLGGRSGTFERYRGSGGDGGVEAVWRFSNRTVTGLQAKFFLPLRPGHRTQLVKSFTEALINFGTLDRYVITLPFDPTPSVGARKGQGEQEKLDRWRRELVAIADGQDREVNVEWWFATELRDRLLALPNADGRILYWFGSGILSSKAISIRTKTARDIAGPRYSPVLKIGTPADDFIAASGGLQRWFDKIADLRSTLSELKQRWSVKDPSGEGSSSRHEVRILSALNEALDITRAWRKAQLDEATRSRLATLASEGAQTAVQEEAEAQSEFNNKHGAENDTPAFRQFEAEYNVRFPAERLDRARTLRRLWRDISEAVASPAAQAAAGKPAMLIGPAGIGKTHAIVDAAEQRLAEGYLALPILGEELHLGRDFWTFLASAVDLPVTASRSEIVGAFSAAAEGSGKPLLLMVDALNETPSRDRWRSWIPDVITAIAETQIRLLVACRDIYLAETLGPARSQFATFEHPGFSGHEQAAAAAFARHYGLAPPMEVVAQPEFANPLFLHMLCQSARERGQQVIPSGVVSLLSLITDFIASADQRVAGELDVDARISSPVADGVRALAHRMAELGQTTLPVKMASELLTKIHPVSGRVSSLLNALETNNLIAIVPSDAGYDIRFTFERLADILIADASLANVEQPHLEPLFAPTGRLGHLLSDLTSAAQHAGLIQALSLIVSERYGIELASLAAEHSIRLAVAKLALDVIAWRNPQAISSADALTCHFQSGQDYIELLQRTVAVATVPDHPLGIAWLGRFLDRLTIVERDALWSTMLVRSWEDRGHVSRLVHLSREEDLSGLASGSASCLSMTLVRFLACADRRVRDGATKGLVRLFTAAPHLVADAIRTFQFIDDDYVLERVLTAVYGAGLRLADKAYWKVVGPLVYASIFEVSEPTTNALIRDHARLIVEAWLRFEKKRPVPDRSSPPYVSTWPLQVSSATWQELRKTHEHFPPNMFLDLNQLSDFGRYIAESRILSKYDLAAGDLDTDTALKWIFEETLRLGYPGRTKWGLAYDWNLHRLHGSGRAKPSYAERLSKKYAWVFLARLAGRLADHVPRLRHPWDPPSSQDPLQGTALRTLDPTALGYNVVEEAVSLSSFLALPNGKPNEPNAWAKAAENFALRPTVGGWTILSLSYSKRHEVGDAEEEEDGSHTRDFRSENLWTEAFFAPTAAISRWTPTNEGHETLDGSDEVHGLYLGEYGFDFAEERVTERVSQNLLGLSIERAAVVAVSDFEPDASGDEARLRRPCQILIDAMQARWDGGRAWHDPSGNVVAIDVSDPPLRGLLIRAESLNAALLRTTFGIGWSMFASRNVKVGKINSYFDQRRVLTAKRGKLREIWARADVPPITDRD